MFHRSRTGAVDVIRIETQLNAESRSGLAASLEPSLAGGRPMAVLEMGQVDLIDGEGLEEILNQHNAFSEKGGELKLADATPLCADILRVTGITDQVEIYGNVKSAVSSFLR